MKVRAINKGYYGGQIRDVGGDDFEVPDEIMADEEKRPSWVEPEDGSADDHPAPPMPTANVGKRIADAAKAAGKPKGKPGRKPKVAEAKDAAKPAEPAGNGVTEALGSPPDWLPPGGAEALKGDDE